MTHGTTTTSPASETHGKSKNFTFRLAEHHLTIVHISFQNGATSEFGPILLGANPASLWKKDELALMELWKKANDPSLLIKGKKAIASRAMPKGDGKQFSTLNTTAQEQLKHCWDLRLRIFTPEIKSILNRPPQRKWRTQVRQASLLQPSPHPTLYRWWKVGLQLPNRQTPLRLRRKSLTHPHEPLGPLSPKKITSQPLPHCYLSIARLK